MAPAAHFMRVPGTLKTATRYVAGWMIVIAFVGLLTFIFSFLGAFFCAALAGMMLGSFKLPRWQTLTLSFIFPAVLFGVLRSGGSELLMKQVLLLAVLCLATFWVTYWIVRAVVSYERKVQCVAAVAEGQSGEALSPPHPNGVPAGKLNLQVLQGKWSQVSSNQGSERERKYLEIRRQDLLLTIRDPAGKISFKGRGELQLHDNRTVPLLSISAGFPESDDTLVCI
jgi:hypothetical protein